MSTSLRGLSIAVVTGILAATLHADVRGTLITSDGSPVGGGRVQLYAASTTSEQLEAWRAGKELEPLATAQSDSKGNFKLEIAKSGNYVLSATAPGFAPAGIETTGAEDLGGLLMRRAAMKTGRVTAGGKPVADAVAVVGDDANHLLTRTDAEGRYSVPDPAVWTPQLIVIHPQFASWVDRRVPGNPPVKLDVRLVPGVTLRGRVVAQDGKTGVSAKLFLDGQPSGTTAADGTFTIEHAAADWREVAALSGKLVARAGRAGLSAMRLSRAVTLSGSVLDAKSRIPLPGAVVALQVNRDDPTLVAEVTSDSKGAFAIPGLLPGDFRINVRHAGYGRTWLTQSVAAPTSRAIYLRKDARLSGIISDSERKAVAGALVGVVPRARGWMVMPQDALVSAPDGRYSRRIPADRLDLGDVDARVEKSGYAVTRSGPHTLTAGDEKVINVTLSRGVVLSGRVIDGKGEPISGVAVATAEFDPRVMVPFQGDWSTLPQTGNDGRFALQVRPGAYTLTFVRTGFGPRTLRDVKANSEATPIEVTLEPSVSISGRVVTSAGDPVPEAIVGAWVAGPAIRVITSDSGSFVIDGLPAELVSVSVYKESMNATEERQIKAPASDVKIELMPGVKVAGRVTAKGGTAVADFTIGIVARPNGGFISDGTTQQFHDSEGRFTMEQVPVRPCDLLVKAPGYATARVALPLEKGKDIDDFEVTLDRAGSLRGRITAENGTPVDRASVRVDAEGGQRETNVEPAVSDANGDYQLSSLPIGDSVVVVTRKGYQGARKNVKGDGGDTRLDVQLSAGLVLTGRVSGDDDSPIAEAEIRAFSPGIDSGAAQASSDDSGRFRLEGLGSGIYMIRATRRGYVDAEVLGVDPSKTPDITVKMSAGATIAGRVTGIEAARLKDVTVRASTPGRSGSPGQATVDAAGNFRLEQAPVGKITLRAFARGGSMQTSETVELETRSGGSYQADLEFKEHNTLSGRVTRRGVPLRAGAVSFLSGSLGSASGSIDADGRYEARGVRSGDQQVTIMDYNDMTQYLTIRTVTRSQTLDIDMNPGSVSGRVISDFDDQPIANASIALEPLETDTPRWLRPTGSSGNDGRLLIENIPPGRYQIRITKEGFASHLSEQTLTEGAVATIQARLVPSAGLALRILDVRNAQPVSAWVGARGTDGRTVFSEFPRARPDGTVSIPLASGSYRLNIIAQGLAPQYLTVTSPGSQEVTLRIGGALELTASDPSIRIRVRTTDGADYNFLPGDAGQPLPIFSGMRIPDLAPGAYLLQKFDSRGSSGPGVPFEIREGQTTKLSL